MRRDPNKRLINFYCDKKLAAEFKDLCHAHGVVMRFQMEKLIQDFMTDYIEDAERHNKKLSRSK